MSLVDEQSLDFGSGSPSSSTSSSNTSPSATKNERCVGCGSSVAIRVHYGASSCHGCKAFFRRSVFESRSYICSAQNRCDVRNESRNRCRSCRLQSCLKGGMNPKQVREERSRQERATFDMESSSANPANDQQLTKFLCSLEKQTESLSDDDVKGDDVMCGWSRDISLKFGLHNPHLVIKRTPLDWSCSRVMKATDIYSQWYRAFVFHADWAMGIPDFRRLSIDDQTKLFKENFMSFGWIAYAYKCYKLNYQEVGIPVGNGAYIPYADAEQNEMETQWIASYGVVCKKLVDLVVKPMIELEVDDEEYCLLKAILLFEKGSVLSDNGAATCARIRDHLLGELGAHLERRFVQLSPSQRTVRAFKSTLLLPNLVYVGQVESSVINHLDANDLQQLSGIPMELFSENR
ncbi:hypothetical protein Q1695_006541 [Nippostrongylus brasiliensis]|nr:hypothetical protein Q1695_006541 [Nippostrongylus brasiliensis]